MHNGFYQRLLRVRRRDRVALGVVYCSAVCAATAYVKITSVPIFEASSIIALKPDPLSSRDVDKTAGRARPEQLARPQIVLLESESVLRQAIAAVGPELINPPAKRTVATSISELFNLAGAALAATEVEPSEHRKTNPELSVPDAAYVAARKSLSVRAEPQTEIIKISFQHPAPQVAVKFTTALVDAFTDRYFKLYSNSDAVAMFWEHQKRADNVVKAAAAELAAYSAKNHTYSIADQRRLLLDQRSNLSAALVATKGAILDKQSQADTIPVQLSRLKPVGRLPQVVDLVKAQEADGVAKGRSQPTVPTIAGEPPLLLVRVYQDTVASLVKLQAELAGSRALAAHQTAALEALERELAALAGKEADFDLLRSKLAQARDDAQSFMKRAREEELFQELNARNLSSVQVLQAPTLPFVPIWPKTSILLGLCIALCAAPFLALGLLRSVALRGASQVA